MIYRFLYVRALKEAREGDRLWFWLSAAIRDGQPALMLTRLADDPYASDLNDMVRDAQPASGAARWRGVADVGPTGAVRFFFEEEDAAFLPALAALVKTQRDDVPALQRLAGAQQLVEIDGEAPQVIESDRLWSGILASKTPASAAVQRFLVAPALSEMDAGERLWFWLAEEGPGGLPALAVSPQGDDEDGASLQRRIQGLRASGAGGRTARGLVRIEENDQGRKRLLFVTQGGDFEILPALGRWTGAHLAGTEALRRMLGASHLQLGEDGKPTARHADMAMWKAVSARAR